MLPSNGVDRNDTTETQRRARTNLPLFVLSFVCLTIALSYQTWTHWNSTEQAYHLDVERNVDHYVKQSALIIEAGLHANLIFTRSYGDLLEAYARTPEQVDEERLWDHASAAIFNGTGLFITDAQGQLLQQYGPLLNDREPDDIRANLASMNFNDAVFSLRYGHQGGYYVGTRFRTPSGHLILISRRAYSNLSEIIHRGGFTGFELVLMDRRNDSVAIREQYYADSRHPATLSSTETEDILYRAEIPKAPWDVIALPLENYWQEQFIKTVRAPATFLLVFAFVLFTLWHYLNGHDRHIRSLERTTRNTEKRADRVLRSIDEALISTDALGRINYLNPKALSLLGRRDAEALIGEPLTDVIPNPNALWNRGLSTEDIEQLPAIERRLNWGSNNDATFEQAMQPLYEGKQISGYVWLLRDITASEQASAALATSRARYKALFEEAGIAHCLLDLSKFDGTIQTLNILSVNDATLHLADFDTEESMTAHYLARPEGLQPLLDTISTARSMRLMNSESEVTLINRSGETREIWVSISFRSGSHRQVLMTMLDVTERKRASEKVREREAFWAHVMQAQPDVVYVLELDDQLQHRTVFTNRHITQILGYPDSEEFTRSNWIDYVVDQDLAKVRSSLQKIRNAEAGQTLEDTARFRHADGSIRVLKFRDTPFVIDENGKVSRYIGTARDVTEDIEQQEQVVDSERRYRLLAENMSDIIWATDAQLNFNFVSTSVLRVLGYQPDELIREGISAIFTRPDLKRLFRALQNQVQAALNDPENARRRNAVVREDIPARTHDGGEVMLELQASLLWNDAGDLQGMLGICRDVTEARAIEQELQLAAEVFESSNEAILITDHRLHIANTNRAFQTITGFSEADVIGKTPDFLVATGYQEDDDIIERIGESLVVEGYWQGEIAYRQASGDVRTGWAGVSAIRDQNHEVQSLIIIMSDITERKASEERIHKLAYFDPLTALPNRSQMHETLERMLTRARDKGYWVVVLFIDLDRFKPINDSMGHPAGDEVLKQVAGRLRHCVKQRDLVCRMGGDEFTIAIADQTSHSAAADTAVIVADRILEALHQSFNLNQREVFISASIGISIFPNDGGSVTELLKNADMAMYHAKDMGRDNMQFFTDSMNREAVQLMELENDLRHALNRQEMTLHYQPQYDTASGNAIGAEALLRWNHPERGMISPGIFIPIIEDTGMIVPIGQWVLEEACRNFVRWQAHPNFPLQRIAVNVSARQFRSDDFIGEVKDIIIRTGIRPEQLELELTESILMEDVDGAMEILRGLRAMGVRTAIDDFGTGYSSLNYLKQFPVDTLKIDRSFIQNLPSNNDDAQISRTIIAMGHNLGMGIIAEGVETPDQLSFLRQAQCEEVQGFYFSKPRSEDDLLGLLDCAPGEDPA